MIVYDKNIKGTLAQANHRTGLISLSPEMRKFPYIFQKFVINHEKGHLLKETVSEIEADNYAISKVKNPKHFVVIIKNMAKVLPYKTDFSSEKRINNLLLKALEANKSNSATFNELKELENMNSITINKSNFRLFGIGTPSVKQQEKDRLKALYGANWKVYYDANLAEVEDSLQPKSNLILYSVVAAVIIFAVVIYLKYKK